MKKTDKSILIKHLYNRGGFGITPEKLSAKKSVESAVKDLFKESDKYEPIIIVNENTLAEKKDKIKEIVEMAPEDRKKELKDLMQESREKIKDLNILWLNRMASGQYSLREKMTLFWHGHFACQNGNAFFVQKQNNSIRQNALGKFGDLLMAVSKDPAMLAFLNNRQNRKNSPNENFAREVMELFTLGRGNYTEHDIKNAAKAFTGWNFDQDGNYKFNEKQHDSGEKTFFGKTGNFSGEEVLKMILENKNTAYFITKKIYKYFVNDQPNEEIVNSLADHFYKSDYDIAKLMEKIFTSDWFYAENNIGKRIKSPVELLTGLQRTFDLKFQNSQNQLFIQKILGQILFYPPNVAGWAEGRNWIDSSSLMFRLQLPEAIFKSAEVIVMAKEDGDVNTAYLAKKGGRNFNVTANWIHFQAQFAKFREDEITDALSGYLLQYTLTPNQKSLLWDKADKSSKDNLIKSLSIELVSMPEYQMC